MSNLQACVCCYCTKVALEHQGTLSKILLDVHEHRGEGEELVMLDGEGKR